MLFAKAGFTENHNALRLSLENDSCPGYPKKKGCVCVSVCGVLAYMYGVCFVLLCVWCDGCVHAHVCVPLFAYAHVVHVECVCVHMRVRL